MQRQMPSSIMQEKWAVFEIKKGISEKFEVLLAKPPAEARLAVPNLKHSGRQPAAQVGFAVP